MIPQFSKWVEGRGFAFSDCLHFIAFTSSTFNSPPIKTSGAPDFILSEDGLQSKLWGDVEFKRSQYFDTSQTYMMKFVCFCQDPVINLKEK